MVRSWARARNCRDGGAQEWTRTEHRLHAGDALYYAGDCTHAFANAGRPECIYYTAMSVAGAVAIKPDHSRSGTAAAGA